MGRQNTGLAREIGRFAVVGVINTAVDLVVLNLLITITGRGEDGWYYSFFKAIAFLAALTNSYLFNKNWTFAGKSDKRVAPEAAQFAAVSIVGLVINVAVSSIVVHSIPTLQDLVPQLTQISKGFWPSFGALCGTAVGLVWNFVGYKIFVFKKKTT